MTSVFSTFFKAANLSIAGSTYGAYQFMKFPGNPEIQGSASNRYRNKPKPFRLSEQYLILAEAAALEGNTTVANNALKTLRENRIEGYTHTDLTGNELLEAVRQERTRELIGEGFRMGDLRRWHLGMNRSNPQEDVAPFLWGSTINMSYPANSYKFTWPIPQIEMEVNPQMAGQQNPGY